MTGGGKGGRSVNEYGIGICLVGDLENTPPTKRQIAAAQALVAYLKDRYAIATDHTETHSHLAASPTAKIPSRRPPPVFQAVSERNIAGLRVRG